MSIQNKNKIRLKGKTHKQVEKAQNSCLYEGLNFMMAHLSNTRIEEQKIQHRLQLSMVIL